ncbi:MAG TPA: hypothetical protein VGD00_11160 [Solirubrobacteraceae bacterium]|jgi:hypothetical protein
MTWLWVALAGVLLLTAAMATTLRVLTRPPRGERERARITAMTNSTEVDRATGAVTSVQRADVLIDADVLEELWTAPNLERLARTYWRFLTRVTLGLIRVRYREHSRDLVVLFRPLRLLSFDAPEYEIDATRGLVRWRIARGLLVARQGRGRGYLQIEVVRDLRQSDGRARLHVEVEVANFYPAIASGLSLHLYNATQSRIHVIVTYGFLRSLTRLDLAESRVGYFGAA